MLNIGQMESCVAPAVNACCRQISKDERRGKNLTRCQYRSSKKKGDPIAGQNMENLKNKSINSKQMNLCDTRKRKDVRLFWKDFRLLNCIAIRRWQLGGQKKNVYTWTHSHGKTSRTRPPGKERLRCVNNWTLGIQWSGTHFRTNEKERRLFTSRDESSDTATQAEKPSNHSFESPIQTKTG